MCQSSNNISRTSRRSPVIYRFVKRGGTWLERRIAGSPDGLAEGAEARVRLFELSSRVGQAQQVDRRRSRDAAIKTSRFNATRHARWCKCGIGPFRFHRFALIRERRRTALMGRLMLQEWFSAMVCSRDVSVAINVLVSGCNDSRGQLERFSFFAEGQQWMKRLVCTKDWQIFFFYNCSNVNIDFCLIKRDFVWTVI